MAMGGVSGHKLFGLAVRILCTVALVFAAFAHQPFQRPAEKVDLSAYVLPGGTLPVLCWGGEGRDDGGTREPTHCEFCRLSGSVLPPAPSVNFATFVSGPVLWRFFPEDDQTTYQADLAYALPRGPPIFQI